MESARSRRLLSCKWYRQPGRAPATPSSLIQLGLPLDEGTTPFRRFWPCLSPGSSLNWPYTRPPPLDHRLTFKSDHRSELPGGRGEGEVGGGGGQAVSQLEKWAKLAQRWHEQGPPATPSSDDVNNFSAILSDNLQITQPTIGILGCTPTLRNRLRQEWPRSAILVIDFCQEMYDATSALVEVDVKSAEEYITADWLRLESQIQYGVDALVGDKSLDNVDLDNWGRFFDSISGALVANGVVVLHVGFPDAALAGQPFEYIIQRWVKLLDTSGLSIDTAAAGLWEDLLSGSVDPATRYISLDPYRRELEEHSRGTTTAGDLSRRVLTDFASQLGAHWARFDELDVITHASTSSLKYVGKVYSHDYHAAPSQPLMVFRRDP